jgi:adenine-specific DNA-methyltransferase
MARPRKSKDQATKTPKAPNATTSPSGEVKEVAAYEFTEKRKNNPEVGLVSPDSDPDAGRAKWSYDPHLAPELQFDGSAIRAKMTDLIEEALASGDQEKMTSVLKELRKMQDPFLQWTGKAEKTSFEVDTVSLHVHEKIDPASILKGLRSRLAETTPMQGDLFAEAFRSAPLREAMDFYKHDRGWANRFVLGDSLVMMNSLLRKEGMAGQVQMIYFDPPYGIKYGSNFQPFVNKRDVKDRSDADLTQEPEMIKAFRDTWELGIHSYLAYLRDRLLLAKELLHESGSVFVQISDENLHLVRNLMDEIFGAENYCSTIQVQKTGSQESTLLSTTVDFLIWYSKEKSTVKYRQLYTPRNPGDKSFTRYDFIEFADGSFRRLKKAELLGKQEMPPGKSYQYTSLISDGDSSGDQKFKFRNRVFEPKATSHWKTNIEGLERISKSGRIEDANTTIRYKRYLEDFPVVPVDDRWESMQIGKELTYVVQTANRVIERCLLMTTAPSDLVLDITCGSGTTAYVAEKWGRRWITCDTSRVALTLAKQRLMTATFDYFTLKYPEEGVRSGFNYKTVPHVTLKSIANNPDIDEIYNRLHPFIEKALGDLNSASGMKLKEWEVPFEFPSDWKEKSKAPFEVYHQARQAMQAQIDDSIAVHADQEVLYDQTQIDKSKVRVTGPFTVEATPFPTVLSMEEAGSAAEATSAVARSGETSRQSQWKDELVKTGIRGKGGQKIGFASLETQPGTKYIQAIGTTAEGEVVAVCFGPEHAALEQRAVARALEEAASLVPKPKFVIFAAFSFDPEAAKDIDETNWPGVTLLRAEMNTDLLTEDLKKARASNESFWLVGQPDVEVIHEKGGTVRVLVHGFDYFDTKTGELQSGGKGKIALWMLDTDYDGRALYPRQVFFPMAGEKEGWNKLSRDLKATLDPDKLSAFTGTESLPFQPGPEKRAAVKIVDDRGIESLKILPLE